jgi:hypothetical protein
MRQNEIEYAICERRGHEPSERKVRTDGPGTTDIVWNICVWCGTHYRFSEPQLIERGPDD